MEGRKKEKKEKVSYKAFVKDMEEGKQPKKLIEEKDDEKQTKDRYDIIALNIPNHAALPHVSPMYFDRVFELLSIDDIFTIYTALMSENKKIVFVSRNTADLLPVIWTLIGFMYPFEWVQNKIPVMHAGLLLDNEKDLEQFEILNAPMNQLIGMSEEAYNALWSGEPILEPESC